MKRLSALFAAMLLAACAKAPTPPAYVPGLGEMMTLNQMRHSKLWFAGQAGNWALASYELEELQEGLDDVARYHPIHKDSPLPIPALIDKIMAVPMHDLAASIKAQDLPDFTLHFDALTAACNSCHQATSFGFNVVTRPSTNPYSNQVFVPSRPGA